MYFLQTSAYGRTRRIAAHRGGRKELARLKVERDGSFSAENVLYPCLPCLPTGRRQAGPRLRSSDNPFRSERFHRLERRIEIPASIPSQPN